MEKLKVYLAGSCKNSTDGGRSYRKEIEKKLALIADLTEKKIECFNPTKYFSYEENKHKSEKQIMDYFLFRLKNSDIVLVNCNDTNSSCGTCMEVMYAREHDIPIIGYGDKDIYPWVEVSCQVVFETLMEALDYIEDYYLK